MPEPFSICILVGVIINGLITLFSLVKEDTFSCACFKSASGRICCSIENEYKGQSPTESPHDSVSPTPQCYTSAVTS